MELRAKKDNGEVNSRQRECRSFIDLSLQMPSFPVGLMPLFVINNDKLFFFF